MLEKGYWRSGWKLGCSLNVDSKPEARSRVDAGCVDIHGFTCPKIWLTVRKKSIPSFLNTHWPWTLTFYPTEPSCSYHPFLILPDFALALPSTLILTFHMPLPTQNLIYPFKDEDTKRIYTWDRKFSFACETRRFSADSNLIYLWCNPMKTFRVHWECINCATFRTKYRTFLFYLFYFLILSHIIISKAKS